MHGADVVEVGDGAVGDLAVTEGVGDDAVDFTACGEDGVGDFAHQSNHRATIHKANAL